MPQICRSVTAGLKGRARRATGLALLCGLWAGLASGQSLIDLADTGHRPPLTFNGTPGIVDMPGALMPADGDLSLTLAYFGGLTRTTLSFQFAPRLTGVFRYIATENFRPADSPLTQTFYDRSFDLRYQVLTEGPRRPAVTLGLVDVAGTGLLGSEYLVATKSLPRGIAVTAGLGFGRLATRGGFDNPLAGLDGWFATRPRTTGIDDTGQVNFNRLFRGDAALFGGITWQVTPRLMVMGEYSSDAYPVEVTRGVLPPGTPYNFGAAYKVSDNVDIGLYAMRGQDIGVRFSYTLNPRVPPFGGSIGPGPAPVVVRGGDAPLPPLPASAPARAALQHRLQAALAHDGLRLEAFDLGTDRVRVRVRNTDYSRAAQAVGRTARHLTRLMPAALETFVIELSENGLPVSATTLNRSLLEAVEFDPFALERTYQAARVAAPADVSAAAPFIRQTALTYDIGPYFNRSFFDPRAPLLFDTGLRVDLDYEPLPGLILSLGVQQPVYSNRGRTDRQSNSVLPKVRSESDNYDRGDSLRLPYATAAYVFRPGRTSYGRVTAGYLEQAFAGVSAEMLWKPDGHRLAYGVELNAVRQRAPGSLTGMGKGIYDRQTLTGFVSAYYDFDGGYLAQIDLGRYLAGDTGATFTLSRDFDNGVQIGAFATLTDVSFDDFGEGAFDKGIFINLPVSWLSGRPSRRVTNLTLRPVLRDGGARVSVRDRLYGLVRGSDADAVNTSWGRILR